MTTFPYLDIDDRVATIDTWFDFDQTNLSGSPDYATTKQTSNNNKGVIFGDGRKSHYAFGLGSVRSDWIVSFLVNISDADDFEVFLNRYAGETNRPVEWIPPDSARPLLWRIDEWSAEQSSSNLVKFDFTFRRVFELILPQSQSVLTECEPDTICETDLGEDFLGAWDVWVARLLSPLDGVAFASGCVAKSGYVFQVFHHQNYIHVSKFKPSGVHVWTRRYSGAKISPRAYYNTNLLKVIDMDGTDNLAICWEATDWMFTGNVWQIYSTGNTTGMLCISQSSGAVVWGNLYFSNPASWAGDCAKHIGDNPPAFQDYLAWNPYQKIIRHNQRVWALTVIDEDGNFVGGYQYQHSSPYTPYGDRPFSITESGYIGNTIYDRVVTAYGMIFAPSLSGANLNTSGFSMFSNSPGAGGISLTHAGFLGNGQVIFYFSGVVGGKDEIVIIGDYGNGIQIVDHVRLLANRFGPNTEWPQDYNDGAQQTAPDHAYREAKLYPSESLISITGQVQGATNVDIDVEMSGNYVVQINGVRGSCAVNTYVEGPVTKTMGADQYSSPDPRYKRIVAFGGKGGEAALIGMNRGMNTSGQTLTLGIGGTANTTLRTFVTYGGNQSFTGVERANRLAYFASVNNVHNGTPGLFPYNGLCPGADIFNTYEEAIVEDVTDSFNYDLYTAILE